VLKSWKGALPITNLAVAVVLLCIGYTRPIREWQPSPWEIAVCYSINAPANLIRFLAQRFWFRVTMNCPLARLESCIHLGVPFEIGVLLLAIAVLWYELGAAIERRANASFKCARPVQRLIIDFAFVVIGSVCVFISVEDLKNPRRLAPIPSMGIACYMIWGFALVLLFGQELVRALFQKGPASGN
jgi:hypothetical protein